MESGEIIAEIETHKATMEFESFFDGVLLHIGVEQGSTAPVDSLLCILGEKGEDISAVWKKQPKLLRPRHPEPEIPAPAPAPAPAQVPAPAPVTPAPAPAAAPAPAPVAPSASGRLKARRWLGNSRRNAA